ncbi:MAG TPA: hypothetical protein VHK91_03685 [Flavisolibacter sp.]|jgi:hypothetical protein|nr:hypothetical protein [Flavisolibacter sp.]
MKNENCARCKDPEPYRRLRQLFEYANAEEWVQMLEQVEKELYNRSFQHLPGSAYQETFDLFFRNLTLLIRASGRLSNSTP